MERVPALKRAQPGHKIMAEAKSLADALALAQAGIDVVQVDKLPPATVAALVQETRRLAPPPVIAAAGGINKDNAARYAATGCHALVTSAPYWAPPADVQVTIERG